MIEEDINALLSNVFFGHSEERIRQAKADHRQFVHYTSSHAALSIINNKEIWLRNASVMNDYAEIAHGESCIHYCLIGHHDTAERSKKVLNSLVEGLHDQATFDFFNSSGMRRAFTYLLSVSEHGPEKIGPGTVDTESQLGRLSMWRAYGSSGGVALVFDGHALLDPREIVPVYVSPVFYGNPDEFSIEYHRMLSSIEQNLDALKKIDPAILANNFQRSLHFASLSTKHPGFVDEREWRLTYSANPVSENIGDAEFNAQSALQREFVTINGVPQRIYKIQFRDYGESGSTALSQILRHAIVGPSQFPIVIADALNIALLRAGMLPEKSNPAISNIPIRT